MQGLQTSKYITPTIPKKRKTPVASGKRPVRFDESTNVVFPSPVSDTFSVIKQSPDFALRSKNKHLFSLTAFDPTSPLDMTDSFASDNQSDFVLFSPSSSSSAADSGYQPPTFSDLIRDYVSVQHIKQRPPTLADIIQEDITPSIPTIRFSCMFGALQKAIEKFAAYIDNNIQNIDNQLTQLESRIQSTTPQLLKKWYSFTSEEARLVRRNLSVMLQFYCEDSTYHILENLMALYKTSLRLNTAYTKLEQEIAQAEYVTENDRTMIQLRELSRVRQEINSIKTHSNTVERTSTLSTLQRSLMFEPIQTLGSGQLVSIHFEDSPIQVRSLSAIHSAIAAKNRRHALQYELDCIGEFMSHVSYHDGIVYATYTNSSPFTRFTLAIGLHSSYPWTILDLSVQIDAGDSDYIFSTVTNLNQMMNPNKHPLLTLCRSIQRTFSSS